MNNVTYSKKKKKYLVIALLIGESINLGLAMNLYNINVGIITHFSLTWQNKS